MNRTKRIEKLEEDLSMLRLMASRKGLDADKVIDLYLDAPGEGSGNAMEYVREKIKDMKA